MAAGADVPTIGLITIPRAVLSVAAGVVFSVGRAMAGDAGVRTARSNAFEAMCADRARALANDETRRLVAMLAATAPGAALTGPARTAPTAKATASRPGTTHASVGSSPRSSASQAALVSTGPTNRD
jgi:hypothetical protein